MLFGKCGKQNFNHDYKMHKYLFAKVDVFQNIV